MGEDYRLPQCLDLLEQKIDRQMLRRQINEFNTQSFHVKRGLGLSLMQFGCNLGAVDKELDHACATVTINPDQTVEMMTGLVEMGQGALTVLSQIGAEALGVPYNWIRPSLPDTSRIEDSGPSAASRVTMMGGQAVIKAATELRRRLTSAAASIAGTTSEAISISDGRIMAGSAELLWQEVYDKARESGELSCTARFDNADQYGPWAQTVCQGNAYVAYTHAAQAALLEVDVQTGQTSVIWVKSVYDIGTVINPALARAQVEGGVVMGLGYALSEDLCARDGDCCVKNLSDYVIPTTLDCPQTIETWFLNEPCSKGPFGAKSLGEPAFVPTIAAVIGAIHDAVSVRVRRCPATPQRLLSAIFEKSSGKAQKIHAKT
jgi:CO/xanthine dehydrogenase Mo-binding subunit